MRSTFSTKSLFGPTWKVHNKRNSNLGLVLRTFVSAKRCDTPCKVKKKFEQRNDINCNRFVFKKYSNDVQHILFEFFFFWKIFFAKIWKKTQNDSFLGGGKPSPLIPRRLIFLVICSSQNPAFETKNLNCDKRCYWIRSHNLGDRDLVT